MEAKTSKTPSSVTTAVRSSRLQIEYQCPQCGAPATIEETDHLFFCAFCRVKSYLLSRVYRYVLPHKASRGRELIYMPYWRFKGMLFACTQAGVEHRIVDVSYLGVHTPHVPMSLGLRSQTQRLRFLTPEAEGRFLMPDISYADMLERIQKRFAKPGASSSFFRSFIGETLSILYAPFYVDHELYDGVLNRPISPPLSGDSALRAKPGGRPAWKLRFVPAQCPECGWDLEGERDSFALTCGNCQSIWHAGKRRFMKLEFGSLPDPNNRGTTLFLPFFRIRPKVIGVNLESMADLVRLGNLPKAVRGSMEKEPFYFWAPAFKIRPQDFLRLSVRTTLGQPAAEMESRLPDGEKYPVTLPLNEALESLKVNLASFMKPTDNLPRLLPEISIEPRHITLAYIPFQVKGNETLYTPCRLRINRNLLVYGRML